MDECGALNQLQLSDLFQEIREDTCTAQLQINEWSFFFDCVFAFSFLQPCSEQQQVLT